MTINSDKLLRMAEQIAANLAYTDDTQVVAAKVADHLGRFWDPRMQEALIALAKESPERLAPVLTSAVNSLEK